MEMQEMNAQAVARQYRMKKTVVVSVGLLLFVLVAAVAFGYPEESPPPRPRKKLEDVVVWKR